MFFFQIGRHPAKLQATVFWRLFGLSLAFRRRCLFFLRHPLAYTPAPAVGDSRHVKLCCVLDKAPAARISCAWVIRLDGRQPDTRALPTVHLATARPGAVVRLLENAGLANPIQSNANKRAQVFLFARIFYNIAYELKHLRFQLTRNENCKEHLDQASVCLDDFWK